jgi:hypothetical protein
LKWIVYYDNEGNFEKVAGRYIASETENYEVYAGGDFPGQLKGLTSVPLILTSMLISH